MNKVLTFFAAFLIGLAFWLWLSLMIARANHFIYLPLVPNTPMMQQEIQTQAVTWCVNDRAANYPDFVNQVGDVNAHITASVGIKFQRVANDSTCQLHHNMTDFDCSGCAAHVFYANWPVVVEYRWVLGYTDWRSAIGHETSHALLGLHERYIDSGGSIQCGGPERGLTVMDCGAPYIRYPQPLDIERGCAIILTSWCGAQTPPPPDCSGPTVQWPYETATWNPCTGRWTGDVSGVAYEPSTGKWYDGDVDWSPCTAWGGRDSQALQVSVYGGTQLYVWSKARWVGAPSC